MADWRRCRSFCGACSSPAFALRSALRPYCTMWASFVLAASLLGAAPAPCRAEGNSPRLAFRTHTLHSASEFSACAVFDVNGDGRLDVFAGGFWYQAPSEGVHGTWKRHFVREVQQIRGRYDDYSNLPLDVNGDGRLDVVSCNYRSSSLYWVEQPADLAQPWTKHVIDEPGPMETGRLMDLDGDGRLDILPNGTEFAAWYEHLPTADAPASFRRHELPRPLMGHGIGAGDINGDGRVDIVSPQGWAEAPEDRRGGAWRWHGEFELARDCGLPILVTDVDADGDADLVWGRGHHFGLYWSEQNPGGEARVALVPKAHRRWEQHAIDTEFSQFHSLLLADLTGDGRPEVIAGKRHLGHDGKDLGEYDPAAIAAYEFLPERKAWRRHLLSAVNGVNFGVDPKASDVDADGDVDVIVSDRSGVHVLENLGLQPADSPAIAASDAVADLAGHKDLLTWLAAENAREKVSNPGYWGLRRQQLLAGVRLAMGNLPAPEQRVPLDVAIVESADAGNYLRHKITFAAEPGDRVPAYLLIPKKLAGKVPAMLCLHQTTGIGKGEPAGLGGLPNLHYAHELAERGYVCLAPDYPSFGDYPFDFAAARDRYSSGSMKAIWNNLRAVDLLESLPQVDRDRIGCIGHSLGGHNALFTAAFDQRIQLAITSCGFTAFHDYYGGQLGGWTSDRYMPRIREAYHNSPDDVPFDFHGILGLIAPRPVFICAPLRDDNFEVAGVKKVVEQVAGAYELLGAPGRIRAEYPDAAHDFPTPTRMAAYAWIDERFGVRRD